MSRGSRSLSKPVNILRRLLIRGTSSNNSIVTPPAIAHSIRKRCCELWIRALMLQIKKQKIQLFNWTIAKTTQLPMSQSWEKCRHRREFQRKRLEIMVSSDTLTTHQTNISHNSKSLKTRKDLRNHSTWLKLTDPLKPIRPLSIAYIVELSRSWRSAAVTVTKNWIRRKITIQRWLILIQPWSLRFSWIVTKKDQPRICKTKITLRDRSTNNHLAIMHQVCHAAPSEV